MLSFLWGPPYLRVIIETWAVLNNSKGNNIIIFFKQCIYL